MQRVFLGRVFEGLTSFVCARVLGEWIRVSVCVGVCVSVSVCVPVYVCVCACDCVSW